MDEIMKDPVLEAARLIKAGIAINEDDGNYEFGWLDKNQFHVNVKVDWQKTTTLEYGVEQAENDARYIAEKLLPYVKLNHSDHEWFVSDEINWYDEEGELLAVDEKESEDEDVLESVDCVQAVITFEE